MVSGPKYPLSAFRVLIINKYSYDVTKIIIPGIRRRPAGGAVNNELRM